MNYISADGSLCLCGQHYGASMSVINTATKSTAITLAHFALCFFSATMAASNGGATPPSSTGLPPLPVAVVQPILPQASVKVTYPVITGRTTAVHAGTNLQAALNAAKCGDNLVLDAGATWTGNYTSRRPSARPTPKSWCQARLWPPFLESDPGSSNRRRL